MVLARTGVGKPAASNSGVQGLACDESAVLANNGFLTNSKYLGIAYAWGMFVRRGQIRNPWWHSKVLSSSKPAPDCYLLALERLGLRAADCLAIEDTQHGVEAACGAGVRCLALPTPMSRHHNFAHAEAVLDGMPQALAYVKKLLVAQSKV